VNVVLPPDFRSTPHGLVRIKPNGEGYTQYQLTNYQAAITASSRVDDGIETRLEFEISATLLGRTVRFSIPAVEFARMDWPIEHLGSAAITYPNQRDYARTAIQWLSLTAEEKVIFAHTGWRRIEDKWMFLHAGGAICSTGSVANVDVRLTGALNRFILPATVDSQKLISSFQESLDLLELGPASVSFALFAATYRATLGDADFSVHVVGETGAFKSELAALYQQHFGVEMDRLHLPGSWSSTGNALEVLAFHAKDVLLTVDDFAPQGNSTDVTKYHATAERLFRAVGNHSARGRLESTAKLRETKPPRALILSSGEDVPRGQSIRARMLILELAKGNIKSDQLTVCQRAAREGRYAEVMSGFLQWLAADFENHREAFQVKVAEFRNRNEMPASAHARTPEILANLEASFELFLKFGVSCGAIEDWRAEELRNRCWASLLEAAAMQAKHHAAAEPASRFMELLRSVLSSGRAHLASRNGGFPDRIQRACGWRGDNDERWSPLGPCIGWVDGDDVYLDPEAAYGEVQNAAREVGEALPVTEFTLRKRLREKKLLATVDEGRDTLTIRRTIGGVLKHVLHLHRQVVFPAGSDDEDDS
jgi:hypothetical protein